MQALFPAGYSQLVVRREERLRNDLPLRSRYNLELELAVFGCRVGPRLQRHADQVSGDCHRQCRFGVMAYEQLFRELFNS